MNMITCRVSVVIVTIFLTSCASWWGGKSANDAVDEPAANIVSAPAMTTVDKIESKDSGRQPIVAADGPSRELEGKTDLSSLDDIGLAQARMNERLKEIERELRRQREVIKLLEQGLLTGIAPDALKFGSDDQKPADSKTKDSLQASDKSSPQTESLAEKSPLIAPDLDADVMAKITSAPSSNPQISAASQEFEAGLSIAKKRFQEAEFSLAIEDFAKLSRQFGENSGDGVLRFWIGKCYAQLKEYSTARNEFESYLAASPAGAHAAEARLELAKTLTKMGLKQRAQNELKRVIKDFDGQDAAEIAAHELRLMQGAL